jgi:molybdopterin synthase sulfur carrier subunit
MMKVTIKLFATLRKGRFDMETRKYSPGTRISQVIHGLNIPKDQVSIIFVNNRHAEPDRQLDDGDVVAFFPPIGGG